MLTVKIMKEAISKNNYTAVSSVCLNKEMAAYRWRSRCSLEDQRNPLEELPASLL